MEQSTPSILVIKKLQQDAKSKSERGAIPSFYIKTMGDKLKKVIEFIVFRAKWILIASIFKLILTLAIVVYKMCVEGDLSTHDIVKALQDVDIVMLANLVKSIITGSYNSFIDKKHGYDNENVSSGILKVKMGSSLIGISSIYLLKVFLSVDKNTQWNMIWMLIAIHCTFLLSSLVLAIIEYLHCKSEADENHEHNKANSPAILRRIPELY